MRIAINHINHSILASCLGDATGIDSVAYQHITSLTGCGRSALLRSLQSQACVTGVVETHRRHSSGEGNAPADALLSRTMRVQSRFDRPLGDNV